MTELEKAARQALEALESGTNHGVAIDALRRALEHLTQPAAHVNETQKSEHEQQPAAQWIGLTYEDEIDWDGGDLQSFAMAIEAKLREKNG